MMLNVTTVSAVGKFLKIGMPLTHKRLTVAGDAILHPKNLEVPIGTPIEDILRCCGLREEPQKIIIGSPMMGSAQMDVHYPITRQNNGLLAFGKKAAEPVRSSACIRCGRCINACPMGLSPVEIRKAYYDLDPERLDRLMADLCFLYAYQERPKPIVMCSNHKKGADTRRECTAGCIGCGKCVRGCPVGAIQIPEKYQPQTI